MIKEGFVIDAISRFAVPFFFMVSGYYSYFKDKNKALNKYKSRTAKLIKLLIISNVIYFIYFLITNQINFQNLYLSIFNIKNIFNVLFLNVSPTAIHLWFLQALIYCYIIYTVLIKTNESNLTKFFPLLLIISLFIGEFSQKLGFTFPPTFYRNFLLMGLPFFTLGYMINDKDGMINIFSNLSLSKLLIFSLLLTIFESIILENQNYTLEL